MLDEKKAPTALSDQPASQVGYQTRALQRALLILEQFSHDQEVISLAGLERSLSLPKPTISRLTGLLEQFGYLRRRDGCYELGPKNFELGSLYLRRHNIIDVLRPILERLRDEVTETVCLAILSGCDVLHLDVIPSLHPIHYRTEVGSRAYAHTTALGKAILATLEEEEVDAVVGSPPYPAPTRKSVTTRKALAAELRKIRSAGFAVDDEESSIGLRCVSVAAAAPILGTVAISVSAIPSAISGRAVSEVVRSLNAARDEIEASTAG